MNERNGECYSSSGGGHDRMLEADFVAQFVRDGERKWRTAEGQQRAENDRRKSPQRLRCRSVFVAGKNKWSVFSST